MIMIMYKTDDYVDYDRNYDHDDDDNEDFYHRYSTLMTFTSSTLFNTIVS